MSTILTTNHGPLIVSSTYWSSEYATAGKVYVSCNAGAIRVLVPPQHRSMIEECRASRYVVCSRGPWPGVCDDGVELLFEDGTVEPFVMHLTPNSFDLMPGEPGEGQAWTLSLWDLKKGKPHKGLERRCFWRRVSEIPCLEPWGG